MYSKLVNFSLNFIAKIDHNSEIKIEKMISDSLQLFVQIDHLGTICFGVGDTLENPGVSPIYYKYNQP